MSVLPVGFGSATNGGYQIERSLRFNSADSAYLNRTVGSAPTSSTLTTFSFWFKRAKLGTSQQIFASATSDPNVAAYIELRTDDTIRVYLDKTTAGSDETSWTTTAVFRDVGAYYHGVVKIDVSQASNANKVLLYINNVSQTLTASQTGSAVDSHRILANGISLTIGKYFNSSGYGDFYLTEFYCIDGQALTPSSFGETDSNTGVWKPKAYSGTYGTNGFYLKFADNSNTTAGTLGKDSSGNGNNWTPNNFSVTAGTGNDSLVDTPTQYGTDTGAGGEVRGNYCTLNPLEGVNSAGSLLGVFSNGNLDYSCSASSGNAPRMSAFSTLHLPSSGKWYCEFSNVSNREIGIIQGSVNQAGVPLQKYIIVYSGGADVNNGSVVSGSTFSFSSTDIIGIAYSADAGTLTFYKNGTQQLAYGSITTSIDWCFGSTVASSGSNSTFTVNFGQRAFAYTAPSGFKALCTQNLPTPTIGATSTTQAGKYFNAVLYTGNGSTQSITGVGFQPDFVWLKSRGGARSHRWWDVLRGVTKGLSSDLTNAEYTESGLTAFDSDGFTLGSQSGSNTNAEAFVSWNWKANGAGSSNTAGTITSTVSANTTSGFSIVTYGGSGASGTVGHGLGVAPSMIIVKNRSAAENWMVYRSDFSAPASDYMQLNTTGAKSTFSNIWGGTATSSVFYLGGNYATINSSGNNYVAYCFANVEGYSRAFSYTGNGSSDGPFVFLGFRPRFVMIKRTDSTANWEIWDTTRSVYNQTYNALYPNLSNAEDGGNAIDINSNGFKLRDTGGSTNATSSATYIGFAVAENPFKYSLGR